MQANNLQTKERMMKGCRSKRKIEVKRRRKPAKQDIRARLIVWCGCTTALSDYTAQRSKDCWKRRISKQL